MPLTPCLIVCCPSQSEWVGWVKNVLTYNRQILCGHRDNLLCSTHTGYDVASYFCQKLLQKLSKMPSPTTCSLNFLGMVKPMIIKFYCFIIGRLPPQTFWIWRLLLFSCQLDKNTGYKCQVVPLFHDWICSRTYTWIAHWTFKFCSRRILQNSLGNFFRNSRHTIELFGVLKMILKSFCGYLVA